MDASRPLVLLRVAALPFETLEPFHDGETIARLERALADEQAIERSARDLEVALYRAAGPGNRPTGEPERGANDPERPPSAARAAMTSPGSGAPGAAAAARASHAVAAADPVGPAAVKPVLSPRVRLLEARRHVHHRDLAGVAAAAIALRDDAPGLAPRLLDFGRALERRAGSNAELEARHGRALEAGFRALATAVGEPLVQQGLYLVGRSFLDKALRLATRSAREWNHRDRYTALKLLAYLVRFATKTSPQGVFCSTAIAGWAERASCRGENRIVRRLALLGIGEARKVMACLAADPRLAAAIVPRANPTLREQDGFWVFWSPASLRQAEDEEVLRKVRVQPAARRILERCGEGTTLAMLIETASRELGVSHAEAGTFVQRLADVGLVVAEVEAPWSEARPLWFLSERARAARCDVPWLEEVEAIEREVQRLDDLEWPERRAAMDSVAERLTKLPHRRPIQIDELFRVDAATALAVALPRSVLAELDRFAAWYARFYAALYPEHGFRQSLARRFLARHPADTWIDAVDVYHGLFEPGAPVRPSAFPAPPAAPRDPAPAAPDGAGEQRDASAHAAYVGVRDALAARARGTGGAIPGDVSLEEFDWDALLGNAPRPCPPCGLLFQVAARDLDAIARGDYRLCLNAVYPGAGLALARLAGLHDRGIPGFASAATGARARHVPGGDDPISRDLSEGWRALERDGAVPAEVSYMHAGRTANAGLRPALLEHEIELPGHRASGHAIPIPLADLHVRFESATRRFRLRSRALDRDVRPVVSSGISPEGFVSFLLMIGSQGSQPLGFFPGFDADGIAYWPRFTLGRVVVFRRRWIASLAELRQGSDPPLAPGRLAVWARWRRARGAPRHVFVHTTSDPKPFYADLDSPWMLEVLERRLAAERDRVPTVHVTEMLPGPEELWVRDRRGRYAAEFLISYRAE